MEKKKRKRTVTKPMKRWTLGEEDQILDYLIANKPIELPTAVVYYGNLIKDLKWTIEPNLVRHKVKNMKEVFYKNLAWVQTVAENEECDEKMIDEHLRKRCPHFKKLEILFSSNPRAKVVQLKTFLDVEEVNLTTERNQNDDQEDTSLEEYDGYKCEGENSDTDWVLQQESQATTSEAPADAQEPGDPLENLKNSTTNDIDKEQLSLQWMRLEIEKEKLSIAREKIAMQREQNQEEAKFRILELEQQGILKRLQIEKDTEVRKYELSLKYKAELKPEM
uniref:Uncharacterized protein n=1 Tax=Lutzomyia longipalpis TaxID=7200 RepID=A0A1B0C8F0_LUTLO